MKSTLLLALVVVLVAFAASDSFAAADTCYSAPDTCWVCHSLVGDTIRVLDLHACDTVRLGCPVYKALIIGDSIAVPVYLFNDEPIGGLCMPFIKDSSAVKFRRFVRNTAIIPADFYVRTWIADTAAYRPHSQTIIIGAVDFTGESPIPAVLGNSGQLLGTMYLLIQPGATAGTISIDSSFIPPAARWEAYPEADWNVIPLSPHYVHCAPDIILGDGEPEPEIVSIDPDGAMRSQQLWVAITGANTHFGQGASRTVFLRQNGYANIYADSVIVTDSAHIQARFAISQHEATGAKDVWVSEAGYPSAVLANGFTIFAIVSVDPYRGFPGADLWVSIIGENTHFGQGSPTTTSVWFSQSSPTLTPINADVVNVISPTQVNAHFLIPMDAPFGLRDVSVQNQGDPSPVTRPNGFEIVPRPALVSVEPDSGRRGDSLSVSITGVNTHFYQSSSSSVVWLSQGSSTIYSSSLDVLTPTSLNAWFSIPQQTPTGLWDVSVSDPAYGLPVATLTNGFTVFVYSCGDVDGSGQIDISDAVYLINYIFGGGAPPLDEAKGDVDCSSQTNIADAVYLVNYVFEGALAPCEGPLCHPR